MVRIEMGRHRIRWSEHTMMRIHVLEKVTTVQHRINARRRSFLLEIAYVVEEDSCDPSVVVEVLWTCVHNWDWP